MEQRNAWKQSTAYKAFSSILAINQVNWGLEGGGPHLTQAMADLRLSQKELQAVKESVTQDINGTKSPLAQNPWGVRIGLGLFVIALVVMQSTGTISAKELAVGSGLALTILAVFSLWARSVNHRLEHMREFLAQLQDSGASRAELQDLLAVHRARDGECQHATLCQHLAHLIDRGSPVSVLEYRVVKFMDHLTLIPAIDYYF